MPSQGQNGESGRSFMVAGWILVFLALLVMSYVPAAAGLGGSRFDFVAGAMVVAGVLLNIFGFRVRRRSY